MTNITSQLTSGALFVDGHGTIYRFEGDPASASSREDAWLRATLFTECEAPSGVVQLVPGATYVPSIDEPSGIGALVVEADSGTMWVKNTDGHWQTDGGRLLDWADLAHPIVRSQGVQA